VLRRRNYDTVTSASADVLIDTSVWIQYLRRKEPTFSRVEELILSERVCCTGIVLGELMQGAKSDEESNVIQSFVQAFDFLPESSSLWLKAGELSRRLRARGTTAGLADCYLAISAHEADVQVFTFDEDFEHICRECPVVRFR
jgi:predicted nucleic acid-binding protein